MFKYCSIQYTEAIHSNHNIAIPPAFHQHCSMNIKKGKFIILRVCPDNRCYPAIVAVVSIMARIDNGGVFGWFTVDGS